MHDRSSVARLRSLIKERDTWRMRNNILSIRTIEQLIKRKTNKKEARVKSQGLEIQFLQNTL